MSIRPDSVRLNKDKALKDLLAYNDAIFDKAYAEAVKDEYETTANLRFDIAWAQILAHTSQVASQWSTDPAFVKTLKSEAHGRYDTYAITFYVEGKPEWNNSVVGVPDSIIAVEDSLKAVLKIYK